MDNNSKPSQPQLTPTPAANPPAQPAQPLAPPKPEVIQVEQSNGRGEMVIIGLVILILIVIAAGGGYYFYASQINYKSAPVNTNFPDQTNSLNSLQNEVQSVNIASPDAEFNDVDQNLQKL